MQGLSGTHRTFLLRGGLIGSPDIENGSSGSAGDVSMKDLPRFYPRTSTEAYVAGPGRFYKFHFPSQSWESRSLQHGAGSDVAMLPGAGTHITGLFDEVHTASISMANPGTGYYSVYERTGNHNLISHESLPSSVDEAFHMPRYDNYSARATISIGRAHHIYGFGEVDASWNVPGKKNFNLSLARKEGASWVVHKSDLYLHGYDKYQNQIWTRVFELVAAPLSDTQDILIFKIVMPMPEFEEIIVGGDPFDPEFAEAMPPEVLLVSVIVDLDGDTPVFSTPHIIDKFNRGRNDEVGRPHTPKLTIHRETLARTKAIVTVPTSRAWPHNDEMSLVYMSGDGKHWSIGERIILPDSPDEEDIPFSWYFSSSKANEPMHLVNVGYAWGTPWVLAKVGSGNDFVFFSTTGSHIFNHPTIAENPITKAIDISDYVEDIQISHGDMLQTAITLINARHLFDDKHPETYTIFHQLGYFTPIEGEGNGEPEPDPEPEYEPKNYGEGAYGQGPYGKGEEVESNGSGEGGSGGSTIPEGYELTWVPAGFVRVDRISHSQTPDGETTTLTGRNLIASLSERVKVPNPKTFYGHIVQHDDFDNIADPAFGGMGHTAPIQGTWSNVVSGNNWWLRYNSGQSGGTAMNTFGQGHYNVIMDGVISASAQTNDRTGFAFRGLNWGPYKNYTTIVRTRSGSDLEILVNASPDNQGAEHHIYTGVMSGMFGGRRLIVHAYYGLLRIWVGPLSGNSWSQREVSSWWSVDHVLDYSYTFDGGHTGDFFLKERNLSVAKNCPSPFKDHGYYGNSPNSPAWWREVSVMPLEEPLTLEEISRKAGAMSDMLNFESEYIIEPRNLELTASPYVLPQENQTQSGPELNPAYYSWMPGYDIEFETEDSGWAVTLESGFSAKVEVVSFDMTARIEISKHSAATEHLTGIKNLPEPVPSGKNKYRIIFTVHIHGTWPNSAWLAVSFFVNGKLWGTESSRVDWENEHRHLSRNSANVTFSTSSVPKFFENVRMKELYSPVEVFDIGPGETPLMALQRDFEGRNLQMVYDPHSSWFKVTRVKNRNPVLDLDEIEIEDIVIEEDHNMRVTDYRLHDLRSDIHEHVLVPNVRRKFEAINMGKINYSPEFHRTARGIIHQQNQATTRITWTMDWVPYLRKFDCVKYGGRTWVVSEYNISIQAGQIVQSVTAFAWDNDGEGFLI
jgi:hypothetical protein